MDITRIMGIGIGRAGNVLLNEFLKKDRRLTGLFVNSAYGDVEDLEKFDAKKNSYIFAGGSGSGRDREYAKEFLADHFQALADRVSRYPNQDVIYVFFSLDGGTGSGISPKFLQVLSRTCPDKKINVVGVLPDFNKSDKLSLENTINCWKELGDIINPEDESPSIIDGVLFIDNSKRQTYSEVNEKAIGDLYASFNMNGKCEDGSIDDNDAKRTLTDKGYSLILTLEDEFEDVKDAINHAIKTTVFAKPNQYLCNYLAVSMLDYDVNEVAAQFEYQETAYRANNNKQNIIAMGGCEEPSEVIETIKIAYDDFMDRISKRSKSKRAVIDLNSPSNDKGKTKKKPDVKTSTRFTADDLDDLFSDLF